MEPTIFEPRLKFLKFCLRSRKTKYNFSQVFILNLKSVDNCVYKTLYTEIFKQISNKKVLNLKNEKAAFKRTVNEISSDPSMQRRQCPVYKKHLEHLTVYQLNTFLWIMEFLTSLKYTTLIIPRYPRELGIGIIAGRVT